MRTIFFGISKPSKNRRMEQIDYPNITLEQYLKTPDKIRLSFDSGAMKFYGGGDATILTFHDFFSTTSSAPETSVTPINSSIYSQPSQVSQGQVLASIHYSDNEYEIVKTLIVKISCEDGIINDAEKKLRDLFFSDTMKFCTYLSKVAADNPDNIEFAENILNVLSHLSYHDLYPLGQTIVKSINDSFPEDIVIQDRVIRCFEAWHCKEGMNLLIRMRCSSAWLEAYKRSVLELLGNL